MDKPLTATLDYRALLPAIGKGKLEGTSRSGNAVIGLAQIQIGVAGATVPGIKFVVVDGIEQVQDIGTKLDLVTSAKSKFLA